MHHHRSHGLPDHPALISVGDHRSRERSRSRLRRAAIGAVVGLLALAAPAVAVAHDGGTAMGISLSAERLPPGGSLEVIGQGFLDGEVVDIRLVGPASEVSLGAVPVAVGGGFAVVLTVPSDTVAGPYRVDAAVASGIVQQADVVIDGSAPAPALTPTPADLLAPPAASREDPVWIWAPLAVVVLAALGFIVLVRRRTIASARESAARESAAHDSAAHEHSVLPG